VSARCVWTLPSPSIGQHSKESAAARVAIYCARTSPIRTLRSCGSSTCSYPKSETAFKELKGDLAIRPIHHQNEERIEAHIFVAFMAYCMQVTLKQLLKQRAPGLTPRVVLEKRAAMQLLDVHFPTTDGRELLFTRYTQPEPDQQLLLGQLGWGMPEQAPPRISAKSTVAV
jgi:hypothetical protein